MKWVLWDLPCIWWLYRSIIGSHGLLFTDENWIPYYTSLKRIYNSNMCPDIQDFIIYYESNVQILWIFIRDCREECVGANIRTFFTFKKAYVQKKVTSFALCSPWFIYTNMFKNPYKSPAYFWWNNPDVVWQNTRIKLSVTWWDKFKITLQRRRSYVMQHKKVRQWVYVGRKDR